MRCLYYFYFVGVVQMKNVFKPKLSSGVFLALMNCQFLIKKKVFLINFQAVLILNTMLGPILFSLLLLTSIT